MMNRLLMGSWGTIPWEPFIAGVETQPRVESRPPGGVRNVVSLSASSCPLLVGALTLTKPSPKARERLQAESARLYMISQMILPVQSETEKQSAECP